MRIGNNEREITAGKILAGDSQRIVWKGVFPFTSRGKESDWALGSAIPTRRGSIPFRVKLINPNVGPFSLPLTNNKI